MKDHIVDHGTNSVSAIKAGRAKSLHYVLPDTAYKDKRTLGDLKKDHISLDRFNGMLARGEIKKVIGEFPNITASEMRGHLLEIYSHNNAQKSIMGF